MVAVAGVTSLIENTYLCTGTIRVLLHQLCDLVLCTGWYSIRTKFKLS